MFSRGVDWNAIEGLGMKRLVSDSRLVRAGDTFVAYPGETRDGRKFIPRCDRPRRGIRAVGARRFPLAPRSGR